MKNRFGFTLIELTVVIVILGILASLSANAYISISEKARWTEAREILLKAYAGYQRSLDDGIPVVAADIGAGTFWRKLGMSDPNAMAGAKFVYTTPNPFPRVVATRSPAGSGNSWTMALISGVVTRAGNAPNF